MMKAEERKRPEIRGRHAKDKEKREKGRCKISSG